MNPYRSNEHRPRVPCIDRCTRECAWPVCLHEYDTGYRCRPLNLAEALVKCERENEKRRTLVARFKRLVRFHWRTWTGA